MENIITNTNWLLGDITASVEPLLTHIIKYEPTGRIIKESDYVKVKLCSNPAPEISETHEKKLELLKNIKLK